MGPIGRKRWAIAEGYIPARSTGATRQLRSHETACLLNAGDRDAHVEITIFYADREAGGPHKLTGAALDDRVRRRLKRKSPARCAGLSG